MLKVTLNTGVVVQVPEQSFAVQTWQDGKWNTICTFPGTTDGHAQVTALIEYLDNSDAQFTGVQIIQLF